MTLARSIVAAVLLAALNAPGVHAQGCCTPGTSPLGGLTGSALAPWAVETGLASEWYELRQAYRDILRREPDASGMRQYVNAMLHEGWSEGDVRRSLANSREYRQRFGRVGFWRYR